VSRKRDAGHLYAIAVGDQWVSGFSYPKSVTAADPTWEKAGGIRVAQCLKAHLGDTPHTWPNAESPGYTVQSIPGGVVVGLPTRATAAPAAEDGDEVPEPPAVTLDAPAAVLPAIPPVAEQLDLLTRGRA
jgi:hypothetical protein